MLSWGGWPKPQDMLEGRDSLEDLDIDGRLLRHCIFKCRMCWGGLHRQMAGCYQHGQRLLGCIKCGKCWPAERLLAWQERFCLLLDGSFVLFRCTDWGPPVQGAMFGNSVVLMPSGHYMYRQFNIQQFYVLPTHCIYVFCVDLRTNSHYFPIQH